MDLVTSSIGQPRQQLVVIVHDDVAAQHTEVLFADVPVIDAVDPDHTWQLVPHASWRIALEQVRQLGKVGIPVDDLDAVEQRMRALLVARVIDLAD
jgi:hypothetical protein